MNLFTSIYQSKDVTPYMQAFAVHTSEFICLHGNIIRFTQQGLEKLNDLTTKKLSAQQITTIYLH